LVAETRVLDRSGVDDLIRELGARGYETIGPVVRDGAIGYGPVTSTDDLPVGWTDHHDAGGYRIEHTGGDQLFGYVVGSHTWKRYLYPARVTVYEATKSETGFEPVAPPDPPRYALIGVRPCELAAIAIQDRVFIRSGVRDTVYASRRENAFLVAVNCTAPGDNCFCTSMGTGPAATAGYDIVLTEVVNDDLHGFLVEAGTHRGSEVLAALGGRRAERAEIMRSRELLDEAADSMGRRMDTAGIRDLLYGNMEHPHWDRVAERCLSCTNCTLVCPTCFCATVEDELDLDGATARRVRSWDSCFSLEFSYIHGGSLRQGAGARYRQWITHKLAAWIDQFGSSGCVGCGRCITWCPVGIDITAEVAALRAADMRREATPLPTPGVPS
jgi:ferredoxin